MKKVISMLGMVVVATSALFVSCIKGNVPTEVPAFPTAKTATYAQASANDAYVWSFASADTWTSANEWLGFEVKPDANPDKSLLNYYIEPNFDWTVTIVSGQEYLVIRNGWGYKDENHTESHSVSGLRGRRRLELKPLGVPAYGSEPVECRLELTMAGQTMPLATIIIEPTLVVPTTPTPDDDNTGGSDNADDTTTDGSNE